MDNVAPVQLDPTLDFIAGTISGMASLAVGFPFDTVKVRFQSPTISGRYTSTFQAISTIVREERLSGLYKGIASPMATMALMNGLVFSSYGFLMKLQLERAGTLPSLTQVALAGAGAGIITSLITTPTELIKIRQQSLLTPTTARQVTMQIIRESGFQGLFRGITATALRDTGYGAYFLTYEATCRYFKSSPGDPLSIPALLLAGGAAGIAAWAITFPFDVVKTRIQASQPIYSAAATTVVHNNHTHPSIARGYSTMSASTPLLLQTVDAKESPPRDINPYRSTWSTFVNSYRADGAGVFFRGLAPTLIRAVPVNMVTFAAFEAVVSAFS
ncbi:carnitine/acyl carnitine carrier [Coprinopsis sp. MPI-PUGE-AT-0042]|nr:carnitine/acyl carnitine carrier [Coprinopsis sp. MPI-PUGE-AT-0042]